MRIKEKIFYWGPFLTPIATPKAIVNSAKALQNYGKSYECSIINFFGEFNKFQKDLENKNIKLINFFNNKLINFLPKHGKLQSRLSFILIFVLSFFPLKKIIDNQKPDFLIIHLITALPLFLLIVFKFETKFILRISGTPRLNYLRKFFWKMAFKKIFVVTCPTLNTLNYIKSLNIIDEKKLVLLYDPVINIKEFNKKNSLAQKKSRPEKAEYIFAAGRLTYQKNFLFLCKCFKIVISQHPNLKLIIAGEGEDRLKIISYLKSNNLEKNIILAGHVDDIYYYMSNSKFFILTSLWEDPGFVLLEAAISRTLVVSSNCNSGPNELIKDSINGILFSSNNLRSCVEQINHALEIDCQKKKKMILNNIIVCKNFTLFNHHKNLTKILSQNSL